MLSGLSSSKALRDSNGKNKNRATGTYHDINQNIMSISWQQSVSHFDTVPWCTQVLVRSSDSLVSCCRHQCVKVTRRGSVLHIGWFIVILHSKQSWKPSLRLSFRVLSVYHEWQTILAKRRTGYCHSPYARKRSSFYHRPFGVNCSGKWVSTRKYARYKQQYNMQWTQFCPKMCW